MYTTGRPADFQCRGIAGASSGATGQAFPFMSQTSSAVHAWMRCMHSQAMFVDVDLHLLTRHPGLTCQSAGQMSTVPKFPLSRCW